jgi:uncharacterized protein YecT (DUF1311 family)
LIGFGAPAAQAEEHEVATYGASLESCFAEATSTEERQACKGGMAQQCMEAEKGGYSTYGMVRCTGAETRVWDRFLNEVYQDQMAGLKALDTEEARFFPEFANRAEALRAAQRAWIAFRDAECGLAYAMWGSGSMRQIAGAGCHLEMTADRVITLESLGEETQ